MIKSLSFRRPAPKLLAKEIATQPTADKLLTWLDTVKPGSVLLLAGRPTDAEGKYVMGVPAKENDRVVSKPSPAMKEFWQLLKGLLPEHAVASEDLWQSAQALVTLLDSEEVRQGGVRHTAALVDALRALSRAQQAHGDQQAIGLEAVPTARTDPLDDEAASFEVAPDSVGIDLHQVWALAAEQRRAQSFDLRHAADRPPIEPKGDTSD